MFAPLPATAAEELIRNIAPPQYVRDAAEASRIMYSQVMPLVTPSLLDASGNVPVVPLDTFYLVVRHQAANAVGHDAIGQRVDYDAAPNTRLAVPPSKQCGPVGGAIAQSTYQLSGYAGGMLTLSWDFDGNVGETQPLRAWPCLGDPDCAGVNKHASYEMAFSHPPAVFTDPTDETTSLAIQGDLRVAQFDAYNRNLSGDGIPTKNPIGEYYFVLYYKDVLVPAQPPIEQIVLAYRTADPDTPYSGEDGINLEIVGASANPFIASSFARGTSSKLFNEVRPDSAGELAQAPWGQSVFYRTHITPRNLRNMIGAINYWLDDPICSNNALPISARADCSLRALTTCLFASETTTSVDSPVRVLTRNARSRRSEAWPASTSSLGGSSSP